MEKRLQGDEYKYSKEGVENEFFRLETTENKKEFKFYRKDGRDVGEMILLDAMSFYAEYMSHKTVEEGQKENIAQNIEASESEDGTYLLLKISDIKEELHSKKKGIVTVVWKTKL